MPVAASPGELLVRKLSRFGRVLRVAGAEVGPGRLQDAVLALGSVDLRSREEVYWALRCTLVSHQKDIAAFDAAFALFWDQARLTEDDADRFELPQPSRDEASEPGAQAAEERARLMPAAADDEDAEGAEGESGMAFSATERLRELDFAEYTRAEVNAARRLVERMARAAPRRLSRRLEAAHDGRQLDKRRTLRNAMRTEGYPVDRAWRRRRVVPRKLVFLVDVSGSMEPYARATIMFLQAAVGPGRKVEAFTFGTRLTRVTKELEGRDPDRALRAAALAVPDWAGGTRIGENFKAFNDTYGPRGLTRGAVVVVVSDGWERGDADLLAEQMRRLHRAAHGVIWVNPLAGDPGYQPLAQGMAASLPHVDHFLPGQNLRALEGLADVLEGLDLGR